MSSPSAAVAVAPLDSEVLLEEILLRLPPQPSSLPRASLVCRRWRRVLSDPGFLGRFRKHHTRRNETPPLLGFFDEVKAGDDPPVFIPTSTTGQRDRIPPARFTTPWVRGEGWEFLGCRHGLALLISVTRREALVWDPLTDHQRRVPLPPGFCTQQGTLLWAAAVMCAADASQDGHVHGDCSFTPFRIALVGTAYNGSQKFACLYHSESALWGDVLSVETPRPRNDGSLGVLVGDAFCWILDAGDILEFDFRSHTLTVIQKPADPLAAEFFWHSFVVRTEDGGLGVAIFSRKSFVKKSVQLWDRKFNSHGVAGWELRKTIQLDTLFSRAAGVTLLVMGYDEDTNSIFLSTIIGDYMLQLGSMEFIDLLKSRRGRIAARTYYPYRNLYITGNRVL